MDATHLEAETPDLNGVAPALERLKDIEHKSETLDKKPGHRM